MLFMTTININDISRLKILAKLLNFYKGNILWIVHDKLYKTVSGVKIVSVLGMTVLSFIHKTGCYSWIFPRQLCISLSSIGYSLPH